jgi:RNA polymerase sigma-70 factor, ECF subfamily
VIRLEGLLVPDALSDDLRAQKFVSLLTSHQGKIYAYILSLVVNYSDADDIMQEASSMMWHKFGEFEPGTDFLAWAVTIAYYRVLEFRRHKKRRSQIQLSERLVAELHKNASKTMKDISVYNEHLRRCIHKLRTRDIELVRLRYWEDLDVKAISARIGRTSRNIYYELSRIQELLLRCIRRSISV